ncbi:MAG: threonine--tRNA ligase [Candidatus Altiarchaeota archaeon]|nr:threonine--tRNA ligase [Candidatus Altiarchaeota archaeon]
MEVKNILEKKGKVIASGNRDELLWFDLDVTPLTQTDYENLETDFKKGGIFAKVINAGSHTTKDGKELQRVWLVAYKTQKELTDWQKDFDERMTRDHRFIGEQLDWFHVQEDLVGPGLPLLHPKGTVIRTELINLVRQVNNEMGGEEIWTPHIAKSELWKVSGHYDNYKDKMFMWNQDDSEWGIKAMNCPIHMQIYKSKPKSYKELPIRYTEFGTVYRKEQSGELHGLSRVWSLTIDDHHFIIRDDQILSEIQMILKAAIKIYKVFGMEYKLKLSTRPEKCVGDKALWDVAEKGLKDALDGLKLEFTVDEGEGAFYGPKIDIDAKDSMGRWWQLGTIQLDFNMPQRFKMTYVDENSKHIQPVLVHFALLGSIERFMSVLIEHTGGRLPLWLAPEQVRLLPIGESQAEYAKSIVNDLRGLGVRAKIDDEGTLGKRIRNSQTQKVAVTAVVGDKEVEAKTVSVRGKDPMSIEDFKEKLLLSIMERSDF